MRRVSALQKKDSELVSIGKIKVVVLGEAFVGKTTLFKRWMGSRVEEYYVPSTSVSVGVKLLRLEGQDPVLVELWDVPSQTFAGPQIFARYLQGAQAIVLVFSLQTPASWQVLPTHLDVARREIDATETIEMQRTKSLPVIMIGNKSDCIRLEMRNEQEAARLWCKDHDAAYVEVSALVGDSSSIFDILKLVILMKSNKAPQ
ncbi:putative small GTP-binding protein [Plasmopara halstedii]